MRALVASITAALLITSCAPTVRPAPDLDAVARDYVVLALSLGHHDASYVDAYYGPDSLKVRADADSFSLGTIRRRADSLIALLDDSVVTGPDTLVVMRRRYLRTQLASMVARAKLLAGEYLSFDAEAKALYDVTPPHFSDAHFDSLLASLDSLVPRTGGGTLAARYQAFRTRVEIPSALVDTVFRTAIAACRARTLGHITLPGGEKFDLEYVKGTSWGGYNWYKGNAHSLIQVNTDFPIAVDRAVDLACHEGYPGHHVYNASLEQALVRGHGWVEFSIYPLFSPQSLIAEGSANFGIDMAFPGEERTAFERDVLFPLAGIDPGLADLNARIREINTALNYARNEVARRYLDGAIDSAQAVAAMERYWLQSPAAGAKTLQFIKDYRSYVINYNLGRDLVAGWVAREGGADSTARWRAFASLLASPRLPGDLVAP